MRLKIRPSFLESAFPVVESTLEGALPGSSPHLEQGFVYLAVVIGDEQVRREQEYRKGQSFRTEKEMDEENVYNVGHYDDGGQWNKPAG